MTFGIWLLRKLWTVVKGRQQLLFACLLHLSVCVSKKIHSVLEVIQIFVIFLKIQFKQAISAFDKVFQMVNHC